MIAERARLELKKYRRRVSNMDGAVEIIYKRALMFGLPLCTQHGSRAYPYGAGKLIGPHLNPCQLPHCGPWSGYYEEVVLKGKSKC